MQRRSWQGLKQFFPMQIYNTGRRDMGWYKRCAATLTLSLHSGGQIEQEARLLFSSYVGALYTEGGCLTEGIAIIKQWIDRLRKYGTIPAESGSTGQSPPRKKIKIEKESTLFPAVPSASTPPLSSTTTPPPRPPNPLAPAQPNLPFLPLFNEAAIRRQAAVEYKFEFSGLAHDGLWTVDCIVNGIRKGVGSGRSKQVAKEEAARRAFYEMKWAPHG